MKEEGQALGICQRTRRALESVRRPSGSRRGCPTLLTQLTTEELSQLHSKQPVKPIWEFQSMPRTKRKKT